MSTITKKVLIIAGSDCSGGAGIQADLKTLTAFGVFGMTAITALTAQNTLGVHEVKNLPINFIKKQMDVCISDIGIDAIKIGMVHKAEIFDVIINVLFEYNLLKNDEKKIVLDPVMFAKGGHALLENEAIEALKFFIKKVKPIVTPNIPEAKLLSGIEINDKNDMLKAGEIILNMGANTVLIKGGHLKETDLVDYILTENRVIEFYSKKIETKNTHGTGCTLASSLAANLAKSFSIEKSMKIAHKYVRDCIQFAPNLGSGHGPINHFHNIPIEENH